MIVSRSQWLLLCWFPLIYSFRRSPQRTRQIYWRNTLKPLPSLAYRTEKLQGEHIHCSHISHLFSGVTCCTVCQMLQVTLHQEKKFHSLCLVHWRIKNIARYFITFLILILIKIKQLQTCIKLSSNVLYCTQVLHFNPGRLWEEYTTNLHKYVPFHIIESGILILQKKWVTRIKFLLTTLLDKIVLYHSWKSSLT